MKGLGICFVFAWLAMCPSPCSSAPPTQPLRILFLGNSFSFYNNGIHTHFRNLLRADRGDAAAADRVKMATISGGSLEEEMPSLKLLLERYDWDVVVLQGHSMEAIDPERARGFQTAVKSLAKLARADGARPVLFMTWAYRDRPEMAKSVAGAYREAGEANEVDVVPVGLAFAAARDRWPELELYAPDGHHPSPAGTYLAACVFYAALVGQPPAGTGAAAGLDTEVAERLRMLAMQIAAAELRGSQ